MTHDGQNAGDESLLNVIKKRVLQNEKLKVPNSNHSTLFFKQKHYFLCIFSCFSFENFDFEILYEGETDDLCFWTYS